MAEEITIYQIAAIIGLFVSPIYPIILWHSKRLSDLCERVTKEETKSDIYHPKSEQPI